MKKGIQVLVFVGTIGFVGALILIKPSRQKISETNIKTEPAAFAIEPDEPKPQPELAMRQIKEEEDESAEEKNVDIEYVKIFNNIEGGTEADQKALADTLFKNGYRYNPETDLPIRFPSDSGLDHFTGMPLSKFPSTKMYKKYKNDAEAAEIFEKNLRKREQSYELTEPKEDMIPVQEAISVAMEACPVEFDASQKPKVNLIRDFYLIFLWEHRRPNTDGTYHVASITIDAYSGEVRTVQVREDLKNSEKSK